MIGYMVDIFLGFVVKQKTAYEMRISYWSSDVCSSDLMDRGAGIGGLGAERPLHRAAKAGGGAEQAIERRRIDDQHRHRRQKAAGQRQGADFSRPMCHVRPDRKSTRLNSSH